ncbi:uncharacterized protein [Dysidea avara]|uniref:uncharacterized protein n=1 Tax=Dysidea avara TaxID=196820 RepID=UPI00332E422B
MYLLNLWRIVQLLILVIVGYLLFKLIRKCIKGLAQCYVLWSIAFGGKSTHRHVNPSVRLHLYVVKPSLLDKVTISELYHFAADMIASDVSIQIFHKILLQYTYAALFRDKVDGSLRGMTLLGFDRDMVEGRKCTVMKVGLVLFKNAYHGGPLLILLTTYHLLKEMILHPFTPLFMIGKSFSYKSYLILTNNFQSFYPRYDKETPEWEKSIMNNFGKSFETMSDTYDPTTGVIKREKSKLKEHVAFISEQDLENPHIRYFQHLNPEWSKGHCLVCMSRISWTDVYNVIFKIIKRTWYGHKAGTTRVKHDGRGLIEASLDERRQSYYASDTYESSLCEVDPWSKGELHLLKRHARNYIRTESVSQRRRSDSFSFMPTF